MANETMTRTDWVAEQYAKALARAKADGVRITDDYGDGLERVWKVLGSSGLAGQDYTVTYANERTLTCSCEAGQRGIYCKHRAVVRERLGHEAAKALKVALASAYPVR